MDYIRISASYLFNIQLDNQYLLIKSERRNQYQPVGGCYKYYPEAEKFLLVIGAVPEKKSNGVDSLMDLRLLVPQQNVDAFIDWYNSGKNRETTYERELNEELVSILPQEQQKLFNNICAVKQASGSFKAFFDEEKGITTIKPMDIVSIRLTPEQVRAVRDVCTKNPRLILATEEEILSGQKILKNNTIVKIGGHTKNILPETSSVFEM